MVNLNNKKTICKQKAVTERYLEIPIFQENKHELKRKSQGKLDCFKLNENEYIISKFVGYS